MPTGTNIIIAKQLTDEMNTKFAALNICFLIMNRVKNN